VRLGSFRLRLTLWTVAVLAGVLVAAGGALAFATGRSLEQSVDRELMLRAARLGGFEPPPPPRPRDDGGRFPMPGGFGGPPMRMPPPEVVPPRVEPDSSGKWPSDGEAQRARWFASPRFIDLYGQPQGPEEVSAPWDWSLVRTSLEGRSGFSTVRVDGERVRVISVPLRRGPEVAGVMQLARPMGELDRLREEQLRLLLALGPLALLVAGLGALFLAERALKPVREVTHAAEQISAEDLSRRLKVRGDDELAALASTFNGMIARLEAAFAQQRRFTADASHELRTPLARIKLTTSEALDGSHTPEEYRSALRVADQAADGMTRLVEQLLLLARAEGGQLRIRAEPVDLEMLLQDVAGMFPRAAGPEVRVEVPEPVTAEGDPDWLAAIVRNLLENALRHTPAEGRVTLSARQADGWAEIRVADTGEGIPAEHLSRLTERFYRVDAARTHTAHSASTGLGLAITKTLVDAHGGALHVDSTPGRGTHVTVRVPGAGGR
jgi:two-component system OmpR family sensor kinase